MNYYPEDFYYEPSEYEEKIEELKHTLAESVKEEFINKMNKLEKENKEFREIKDNYDEIKREYKQKERKLELDRNNLKRDVRHERLSDLMEDFHVVMYKARSKREKLPKCNKCNKDRKIYYNTPLGRETYEYCDCKDGKEVYYPEEFICSTFAISSQNNNELTLFYKLNEENDYYAFDDSIRADTIYNDEMSYEDINTYRTFFKSKEECQKYCDYLNENKK